MSKSVMTPSVKISYPGKNENKVGKAGHFLCPKDSDGKYLTDKDDFNLKDVFTPEQRENFLNTAKTLLQNLELKYPVPMNTSYAKTETAKDEKSGKEYQKIMLGGDGKAITVGAEEYNEFSDNLKAKYKEIQNKDFSYRIDATKYTDKDGYERTALQLTISDTKHESVRFSFNKDSELMYVNYNKNNTFVNNQPAADSKWVKLEDANFSNETLQKFANDLSLLRVRGEKKGASFPTIYTEVRDYIKEHTAQTSEGKADVYLKSFNRKGDVQMTYDTEKKESVPRVNKDGEKMLHQSDNFEIYNHDSEKITIFLEEGEVSALAYTDFKKELEDPTRNVYAKGEGAMDKIIESARNKNFVELVDEAIANYQQKQMSNIDLAKAGDKDTKDEEFLEVDTSEKGLPF